MESMINEMFLVGVDADLEPLYTGSAVELIEEPGIYGTIVDSSPKSDVIILILDEDLDMRPISVISDEIRKAVNRG
jgi:hypothetical protein